jgi:hypothetical protein
MKYESEFREYLTNVRKSSKTREPYSSKVVTDLLRRCHAVEALLSIELPASVSSSAKGIEGICATIRQAKLSSTPGVPYAHLSLINAIRIYSEFLLWRRSR